MPPPPSGPSAPFSFLTLLVLLCVLGLSCLTFWLLVRRATSHRRWVALSDWARARGFRYRPIGDGEPPEPFSVMPGARPRVRLWLASEGVELLQLEPPDAGSPASAGAGTAPAKAGGPDDGLAPRPSWHVLIRRIESNWPPTALRPTAQDKSPLDLFSLASFPSMIASERFVIFGADSAAARTLSKSSLPALLPPDVGLLLHARRVVLDFSARPFDTIEFDRMLALANSLTSHLPALKR
jgi:hypothetical protein